ncbi:hypothetical protein K2173_011818 [Erythroxylum novogranatense]|uniref:Sister chromatid cohesion 1 protein 4-like n=1 Tax=Erythroxylum novogranatense TaxID=1862640 RepID=A0AAV8SLX8_9ROSI|nr:hypothetical protein K2173_011818 [Erythroxylum novogranatense]
MFYSQFILAKKGPLGTIWIAAHLERKLRKNQVADTDIGVSVDSILFPEVPIALRLSSHLLLGVVRIYSRKVNYLFDDCSEALLKVKQAFRSNAVDLPPEETTAPYHSITLPETFDLEDFELPDNDIFQGNYVDHHVSTKEQITLQDNMEHVVYFASRFGLDERFGDGDTSQVGLELEEDLFPDKVAATGLGEIPVADPLISFQPPAQQNVIHRSMTGSPEMALLNSTTNKIEAANSEPIDYAQAPSTPGLLEEPNLSSVQKGMASEDHLESEDHNLIELVGVESAENASIKSDLLHGNDAKDLSSGNVLDSDVDKCMATDKNIYVSGHLEMDHGNLQMELQSSTLPMACIPTENTVIPLDASNKVEELHDVDVCSKVPMLPSIHQINRECDETVSPSELVGTLDVEGQDEHEKAQHTKSTCVSMLLACTSNVAHPDDPYHKVDDDVLSPTLQLENSLPSPLETSTDKQALPNSGTSTKVQGEECHVRDGMEMKETQTSRPDLLGEFQTGSGKIDEQLDKVISGNNELENMNDSLTSNIPEPEKLLFVSCNILDKPDELIVESTLDKEVSEGGGGSSCGTKISGKKRSFTESMLSVQSLKEVESFGNITSKRTADSIPDDNDLLSSILVGRRSSVLKMKPTPPAPEVESRKRAHSLSRPSAVKRKVLMDDSMVLLGDTIRQQLTNTEGIRRVRRKAPCTRSEILMIQRQFLEEDIFSEQLLCGLSSELRCLHGFDISGIIISENCPYAASFEEGKDKENSFGTIVTEEGVTEPSLFINDVNGQFPGVPNQHSFHQSGVFVAGNQIHMNVIPEVTRCPLSECETLGEIAEIETDRCQTEVAGAGNDFFKGFKASQTVSGDNCCLPAEPSSQYGFAEKATIDDVCLLKDNSNSVCNEIHVPIDGAQDLVQQQENIVAPEIELRAMEEVLLDERKVDQAVEIKANILVDHYTPGKNVDISIEELSRKGECINLTSFDDERIAQDIDNYGVGHGDDRQVGGDDKEQVCNDLFDKESKGAGFCGDFRNDALNAGYPLCEVAVQQSTHDMETFVNQPTGGDHEDLHDIGFANDTDFLNVDDDEIGEDGEDGVPCHEDTCLLENSGWSSRTRAVAKYLQTLFSNEARQERKVLSVDNLLVGKTRKEASRMFFETLVLKTRDYIHVQQVKPFDSIDIEPRIKLMKSEF